jgi:outer membrane protein
MKAVVLTLSSILLMGSQYVQADLLGVTLNADFAKLSATGSGGDHQWSQPLQFADDSGQNWSVAVEHPLPLLPNIMLRRQTATWSGQTQLAGNLQLDQQIFARQSSIGNMLDFKSTDVSFYYEVLDNSLLALDLGATAMVYDAKLAVTAPASRSQSVSGFLPLLYGNLTVYVWGTDTALFLQGNYTDYRQQLWSQTKVGIVYELLDLTALTLAVKLGWQQQSVKLTDKDQLDLDVQFKGPFLALEADF